MPVTLFFLIICLDYSSRDSWTWYEYWHSSGENSMADGIIARARAHTTQIKEYSLEYKEEEEPVTFFYTPTS